MMLRPVADYLVEIGLAEEEPPAPELPSEPELAPLWPEEPKEDPQIAIDAAREEGRVEGFETAKAECAVAHAAELVRVQQRFDTELAAAREAWSREEGARLREQIAAGVIEIEMKLADSVGRVLQPFIIATLRKRMIDRLIENVRTIAASAETIAIQISAPADLIEILRIELQGAPAALDYVTRESVDVRVVAEQTSIETRLKAWTDLIGAGD